MLVDLEARRADDRRQQADVEEGAVGMLLAGTVLAGTVLAGTVLAGTVPVGVALPLVMLGGGGVLAGAGARVLLRRLRRGTRIPPPWCELGVGVLWAATGAAWAVGRLPAAWMAAVLGLGWLTVAAGAVDLRHRRLPNALTVPALPVALVLLLPVGPGAVVRGAGGAAVAAAVHVVLHLADRRAVGAGDVKLAAPLGAVLAAVAWPALALAAVVAAAVSALLAVAVVIGPRVLVRSDASAEARAGTARRWRPVAQTVPHGPSMLGATWLVTVVLLALGAGGGGGGR